LQTVCMWLPLRVQQSCAGMRVAEQRLQGLHDLVLVLVVVPMVNNYLVLPVVII